MSAEGAALHMHCKYSFVPHLRCSFLLSLPIPTLRSGLLNAGPSGLKLRALFATGYYLESPSDLTLVNSEVMPSFETAASPT